MAVKTFTAVKTTVVSVATDSVTIDLSSISGYTSLKIVSNIYPTTSGSPNYMIRFNGDTSSIYSNTYEYHTGSAGGSGRNTVQNAALGFPSSLTAASVNAIHYINGYSVNGTNKTILTRVNDVGNQLDVIASLWRGTDPITSITFVSTAGNSYAAGSSFTIYATKAYANAEVSDKATGGYVYSDATYWYHAFPFTSAFTPNQSLTADILVVAGGGGSNGGGDEPAGGGGAGGLLTFTSQSLTAQAYTVTVGAGGTGGKGQGVSSATSGGNSRFGALTLVEGGGYGGYGSGGAGANGGSGGGGSGWNAGAGGTATSGQGYNGGVGRAGSTAPYSSGGGGGAGAAGTNGDTPTSGGGNGGIGATSAFINTIGTATQLGELVSGNYYFAGGGGGGSFGSGNRVGVGGSGGGGNGQNIQHLNGTSGLVSTGGGGGAGVGSGFGGSGGSGIVVVRYAK